MATHVHDNVKLILDGYDLSGDHNSVALEYSRDELDDTMYGDGTRIILPGLRNVSLTGDGHIDFSVDGVDSRIFTAMGGSGTVLMLSPDGGAEGEIAYMFEPDAFSYQPLSASVGDIAPFSVSARARGSRLIRGTIMQTANDAEGSSFTTTARQLGALSSTQKLYMSVQCIAASGTTPTLDAVVRSDDNAGMTSPTTRGTFTQITAGGVAEWLTPVSGAITDDYWDVDVTIGGTGPSFTVIVVVGIA